MEANQASTQQSVCPKCGKSVQSDFTRCPYCGAKLQVDPNDKVEKVKQGFFNFLSKAKDFFISAGKLAMSHKKITIAISAVLVLLIVLIPIITTFTNPLHPNNVAKVDVGVLTEQQIKDTYGQPSNVINAYSIQGISLGVAQGMCREAWVYYDDAFAKKLKAFEEKFNNAESFEDLEKLDKEYNKLTKEKFDCLVVGFDMDGNVSFVCLNKNAKYDELDVFASKEPKELKNIELTKNTLCRGSSVADSNISYIAKYKDGSLVKAKITTNGIADEEDTIAKVDVQSIFGDHSFNFKVVEHSFDSNCYCRNCQLTLHNIDEKCHCDRCNNYVHSFDSEELCSRCNCDNQGLRYELIDGEYSITKFIGASDNIIIPSTINNLSVTSIGSMVFMFNNKLTSITISENVTNIRFNIFLNLKNIVVQEGNPKYHSSGNCLIETESKTLILGCSTSVIPIDGSVTSIGEDAFCGCYGLTSIIIPDNVTSIGSAAFLSCSSLTTITFQGTRAQWNAISKGRGWDSSTGNYTIYCIDGTISKS